ncbi:19999_t:CDS:2, partial [Gigaspora margarita]
PTQENQTLYLDDTNEDDLTINTTNLIVKLDRIKLFQKFELIMDLNGQIEEMQEFIYNQEIEIEELKSKLDDQENEIEDGIQGFLITKNELIQLLKYES